MDLDWSSSDSDYPILSEMAKIYLAASPDSVPRWSPCLAQQATCWIQKDHQWHHINWTWCCSFMTTIWCGVLSTPLH